MGSTGVVVDLVFGPRGEAAIGGYNIIFLQLMQLTT